MKFSSVMRYLLSTILLCFLMIPAHAADAISDTELAPVPVTESFNWNGAYITGFGGGEWSKASYGHLNVNNFGGPPGTYDHDGNGFIYGAAVGYNYQFANNFVLGVEATIRHGVTMDDGGAYQIYHNTTETKTPYLITVAPHIGYAFDRWMPYILGGYAGGSVETSQVYSPPGLEPTTWNAKKFRSGYVIGAGVQYAVTDHIIVGAEYNHIQLSNASYGGYDSTGTATHIGSSSLKSDSIMARLTYKF